MLDEVNRKEKTEDDRKFGSVYNEEGVKQEIVKTLMDIGIEEGRIGIITPYVAQAKKLREVIKDRNIEINTVDSFQGRERYNYIFCNWHR